MALIELPTAPEGMTYVNKVTASGAQTVLVDKASLSDDVCTATGRTWAEEAKLYNIQNAPDGKKIAEPGDQFYQTAETMKNRGNLLGGAGASNFKLLDELKNVKVPTLPTLAETMDKIKSGSINANLSAGLDKIGSVTTSLPADAAAGLSAAKAAVAAKMAAIQKDLPTLMAKANASVDALTKKAIAATGKPPTEAEIKATQGSLSIIQDGPKMIEAEAAKASQLAATAGKDFGVKIPAGIDAAKGFAKAGLDKVTDLAKNAGDAITKFVNSKPAETIVDPTDPTKTIPNPSFTAFAAKAGNATKLLSVDKLKTSLTSAGDALSSKFEALETKVTAATTAGGADVKALGFAAKLAAPAVGLMAAVKSGAFDPKAFDAGSISKAFSQASKLGPSVDTALYSKTKDEDLTYTGDDGLVWDRINTERLRRSLSALPNARPKEPPLVPAGTTPPKPPESTIKVEKVVQEPPAAVADAKKTGLFGRPVDEKVSDAVVTAFYNITARVFNPAQEAAKATAQATGTNSIFQAWYSGDFDYNELNNQWKQITTDKPDVATRTPEENLIVKKRTFYRQLCIDNSDDAQKYTWVNKRRNEVVTAYQLLKDAVASGKTYGDVPKTVEQSITDDVPALWKKNVTSYATYAEFAKANPDKSAAPTA